MSRSRSGSRCSPSVVDPVTSANSTVTSLRSSPAATWGTSVAPQFEQKRASASTGAPQDGQAAPSADPQREQNRAPPAFVAPQAPQVTTDARVPAGGPRRHGPETR